MQLQMSQPAAFEFGARQSIQDFEVFTSGLTAGRGVGVASAHPQQHLFDRLPVQQSMDRLVGVVHQAVVTGGFAFFCVKDDRRR